ncbi:hypothetical protein VOLCADRAFT_94979 [Volvox carteri f. nagariensis]|uniref:Uncharacterized protein n=1 Tax=Volvox carteri f. nagariensis TaxID=3068 RepID=D8U6A2_VOLCA|nr:uncharacterized protein VOLCADRAFT_94979 [Volvox carteri f. nagariensis]EFJ44612.1 hypothetical protein VOLCADRAFT_94979 [Volvox carteri f. nagariensis]|eukprot:XP_002954188.1 hypothetical protein VOLCADRAFT_94979 [Volvox carteri f. nagariensis]
MHPPQQGYPCGGSFGCCLLAVQAADKPHQASYGCLMFGGRWQWRVQLKSSHGYQWQPHQGAEHHHCLSQLCCGASKKTWLNGHSTEKIGLTKRPGTTGYSGGSDDQEHHQPTQQCSSLQQPRPDPTALGVWLVLYCMHVERSGENCTVHTNEAGDDIIMMCNDCIHALECGRIPEAALTRYDGGDVPEINQDGQHLEWPTVLEANILGLGHVQQQIYTLKVKNRPPDLQPITVTMHKIAMANPSLDQWVDTIPCSAVSLPENITVLCMDVVSSKEELLEKLKSTKDAGLEELGVLVPVVPDTTVPGLGDDARNPVELHRELTAEHRLVFASGGRGSKILDYSREDVLASNFPTAFLYTKGGLRPLGMSNRTFFQHVSTRVPQQQLSGNLLMLARMVDVLNMEDAKVQTWVTVKCCQQDIDTVGAIPREAVKAMADILALPKMHPDRRHLLQDMSPLVHTLVTSLRRTVARIDMTDAYYHNMHANLRVRLQSWPLGSFWNLLAFMDILFGFKPGDKRQSNPDCFCGTVFHICICYMAARAPYAPHTHTWPGSRSYGPLRGAPRFILRAKALLGLVGAACRASTIHEFWRELKACSPWPVDHQLRASHPQQLHLVIVQRYFFAEYIPNLE